MNWVKFKAQSQLNKKCSAVKHSKIKGVPKLDDANDAGNKHQTFLFFSLLSILEGKKGPDHPAVIMFSDRWEELHWLHTDPY